MKGIVVLAAAGALLSIAQPGVAAERCVRPYAPTVAVTPTTTKEELVRLQGDIKAFMAASDVYQSCLVKGAVTAKVQAMLNANQADKERVAGAFNAAIKGRSKA
ncbi:MAG: hypothetical protein ACOY4K_08525 [Pseudomonadota bacterium]